MQDPLSASLIIMFLFVLSWWIARLSSSEMLVLKSGLSWGVVFSISLMVVSLSFTTAGRVREPLTLL